MTTHITRSGNSQRLRLFGTEESKAAGAADAQQLLESLNDNREGIPAADLLFTPIVEIIALASENRFRFEESEARLTAFCSIIGPVLERTAALEAKCALLSASLNQADRVAQTSADEQRAIHAAIATCSQVSAGRIIAAHPEDDDAIVTLAELQMAVRALEPKFTDTEGGEL